jgi:hypothetical protein
MRKNDSKGLPGNFRPCVACVALVFAAGLGLAAAAEIDTAKPTQVFILAGQSNMEGQGVVEMDHPKYYNSGKGNLVWSMKQSKSAATMKHLKDAAGKWVVRDDVEISFKNNKGVRRDRLSIGFTGYGGRSHIGPELQFGHVVGDHFAERVFLIKTAWGGKSLYKDFRPPSAGGEIGPYYTMMIEEVRGALKTLGDRRFVIAGFVWFQGWNDMFNKDALAEYEQNLVHLAADVRREFKAPALPFVIGELGNGGPKAGKNMLSIRAAQKAAAGKIAHAVFVSTTAFARPAEMSPNVGHGHHWFGNAECYFLVGDALGKGMLRLLKAAR